MNHHSECFLDNEYKWKHIYLIISLFPLKNTKMKSEKGEISFFELYEDKMKHMSFI